MSSMSQLSGIAVLATLTSCGGLALSNGDGGPDDGRPDGTSGKDSGSSDGGVDSETGDSNLSDGSSGEEPDEDGGCPSGDSLCGGVCVNKQTNPKNCGGCGLKCSVPCVAGECLVTLASGQDTPWGIAVDDTSVYWTNQGAVGSVDKVPLGGGKIVTIASGQQATGIAVDATSVYWAGNGNVLKIPLDGGEFTTLASGANKVITLDGMYVYWTDIHTDTVLSVPLDGGSTLTLASGQSGPFGSRCVARQYLLGRLQPRHRDERIIDQRIRWRSTDDIGLQSGYAKRHDRRFYERILDDRQHRRERPA